MREGETDTLLVVIKNSTYLHIHFYIVAYRLQAKRKNTILENTACVRVFF